MVKLSDFLVEAASSSSQQDMEKNELRLEKTIKYLQTRTKVLLIGTSNRWEGHKDDEAKSTKLAKLVCERLGSDKCEFIDVSKLNIFVCEGNVSSKWGNHCGEKGSLLKDKDKNPSGHHRCWASINNKSDELWKITKPLFESDTVLFFTSIRWGQTNSIYQKLIERLTWIENRHSTLGEANIVKNIDAGVIAIGQNWNGKDVTQTQKHVLEFYGFNTPQELFWNWQYTDDARDETKKSYSKAIKIFDDTFIE
jgi:multimeric flavodoxin WrbA